MIFVRDKGRMCNNLLQYAHVYAWGREHGRSTLSMRFAYKYPWFHISDTRYHNTFFYLLGKFCAWSHLLPVVSFDSPSVDLRAKEQEMLRHRHQVVEGWYVSFPDLFLKYKAEILGLFAFHEDIIYKVREAINGDGAEVRVGLHVRRGDYKTWMGGRYLYTDAQFISLTRQMQALLPGRRVHFYVCGNDPSLNQAAYAEALGAQSVSFPAGNPAEDLCLLSCMDWLIGPPSTFTLVAAMYRDVPLYRILDASEPLSLEAYEHFDELFTKII